MVDFSGDDLFGATPLDDYSGIKLQHIVTRKELYEAEFSNISKALSRYLLKPLALEKLFIRDSLFKVHAAMFGEVWTWAGQKRTGNKSVGIDKHQIDVKIHQFINDYNYWEQEELSPLDISVLIHHRLVQVHPFENGNGRWARTIVNMYLKQKTGQIIKWPEDEFFINSEFRKKYIFALKDADNLDDAKLTGIHKELIT
jgi:Fic-DOC domain mobile mystery protein B